MIVLVCGGRDFTKKMLLDQTLDSIDQEHKIVGLVHGACKIKGKPAGADKLAAEWMDTKIKEEFHTCWLRRQACPKAYRVYGIQYNPDRWMCGYPANWDRDGKAAGPIRNKLMLDMHPGIRLVVAFSGGRGTRNMVEQASKRGIQIKEAS